MTDFNKQGQLSEKLKINLLPLKKQITQNVKTLFLVKLPGTANHQKR
jgi:hypothetical protein